MSVDVREVSSYEELEQWAAVRTAISVEDPHDGQRDTLLRAQEVTRVDLLG